MLERDIFFLLDKTTENMFPELNDDILSNTININEIKKENVIYHLKDNEWMINYMASLSPSFSKNAIQNYMSQSKLYKATLFNFEQKYSMFRLDRIIEKMLPEISFELLFKPRNRTELTNNNIVLTLENKEWLINYLGSIFFNYLKRKNRTLCSIIWI